MWSVEVTCLSFKVLNPSNEAIINLLNPVRLQITKPLFNISSGSCGIVNHSFVGWFLLTDKPPLEELHPFLEFQLPRQWAPVFSELPLGPQRRQQNFASLQFSFMGPRLYVNTAMVLFL